MKTKILLLILLLFINPLFSAHLRLLDTPFTPEKLSNELVVAGIPITSIGRLSRDIDEQGRAVLVTRMREDGAGVILDENNAPKLFPKKVTPYLLIKSKQALTVRQIQQVKDIVATHVPDPEPTVAELEDARKEALLNDPLNVARMKADAKRTGISYDEVRRNIKAEL